MSGSSNVYLITGANRGLGLGLVTHILQLHASAFVYAGVRDPEKASELTILTLSYPDRLTIVKLVSGDVLSNASVAKQIEAAHGRLDTVIANAAIAHSVAYVSEINPESVDEHFHVNVTGVIVLFQSVYSLLKKSATPRFIPISSSAALLDGKIIKLDFGGMAYGASKVALNWVTRKIHFENDWLTAFPICPGAINTEMLHSSVAEDKKGALFSAVGSSIEAPTPLEVATSLVAIIDRSTRDREGGQFYNVKGEHLNW